MAQQSDYIKYKKTAVELQSIAKFPAVLAASDYTKYRQYTLENTVVNTSPAFNQLTPPWVQPIFGMQKARSKICSPFIICHGTQNNVYRKPMQDIYAFNQPHMYREVAPLPYIKSPPTRECALCCSLDRVPVFNTDETGVYLNKLHQQQCVCNA